MLNEFTIPPQAGKTGHVVLFLHGLGDRGDGGLLGIGEVWQRALPPDTEFICPDAPFPYDMAPEDFGGRQWFSLSDRSPEVMRAGIARAMPILDQYIDHVLRSRGITPAQLAVVGFSQGTMMALQVVPRRAEPVACVVGYSGLLRRPDALKAEKKSAPPVLLIHGTYDDVVPYTELAAAEKGLKDAGIPVSSVTCPQLGHSINDRGVVEGLKFVQKFLG